MPGVDEIKEGIMENVESDLDAWEGFYKRFKGDLDKIGDYQKKVEVLEDELKRRDNAIQAKIKKEKGNLFAYTVVFFLVSAFFVLVISKSLNVWLYFLGGMLIGLGAFSLLYLWTR